MMPIFVFWLALTLQFVLFFMQYYSVQHVTRETGRWLSMNPNTIDTSLTTYANSLRTNLPGVHNAAFTSVTATPGCASLVGGVCPGREPGEVATLQIQANISSVMIFPTTIGVGWLSFSFPSSLPAYRVAVLIE